MSAFFKLSGVLKENNTTLYRQVSWKNKQLHKQTKTQRTIPLVDRLLGHRKAEVPICYSVGNQCTSNISKTQTVLHSIVSKVGFETSRYIVMIKVV